MSENEITERHTYYIWGFADGVVIGGMVGIFTFSTMVGQGFRGFLITMGFVLFYVALREFWTEYPTLWELEFEEETA